MCGCESALSGVHLTRAGLCQPSWRASPRGAGQCAWGSPSLGRHVRSAPAPLDGAAHSCSPSGPPPPSCSGRRPGLAFAAPVWASASHHSGFKGHTLSLSSVCAEDHDCCPVGTSRVLPGCQARLLGPWFRLSARSANGGYRGAELVQGHGTRHAVPYRKTVPKVVN